MKKRFTVIILLCLLSFKTVDATLLSTQLPGGKNYIDENNFSISDTYMETIDPIKVIPNTYYTLTIPGPDVFGEATIYVSGTNNYIQGTTDINGCVVNEYVVCTFYNTDNYINIEISSSMIGLYHSYYGLEYLQLEVGEESTTYEAYVPPLQDTTSPEFSNTGAYITDYNDQTSVQDIVSTHVVAIDEIDGDISDQIIIVDDQYTQKYGYCWRI